MGEGGSGRVVYIDVWVGQLVVQRGRRSVRVLVLLCALPILAYFILLTASLNLFFVHYRIINRESGD